MIAKESSDDLGLAHASVAAHQHASRSEVAPLRLDDLTEKTPCKAIPRSGFPSPPLFGGSRSSIVEAPSRHRKSIAGSCFSPGSALLASPTMG